MRIGRGAGPRGKRGGQLELLDAMVEKRRGGKRRGAGRPAKGARASEAHKRRPFLDARHPVHVVLRVERVVGALRRRLVYRAVRAATQVVLRRADFRIVHLSIQRTHLHLLVEANSKAALAAGMQSFQISAAKRLNAAISQDRPGPRRRGRVFPDRYHAETVTSPTQAHHALSYVINNWRKHQEDRGEGRHWSFDPYSSASRFSDWLEDGEAAFGLFQPPLFKPLAVQPPRTWLLREGWKKAGPISCHSVPSRRS
jgi:REP element-mobilizing transposase RayT